MKPLMRISVIRARKSLSGRRTAFVRPVPPMQSLRLPGRRCPQPNGNPGYAGLEGEGLSGDSFLGKVQSWLFLTLVRLQQTR